MRICICVVTGQKKGMAKAKAKGKSQASVKGKAKAKSQANANKGVVKAKAVVKVLKKPAQQGDEGEDEQTTYVDLPEHGTVKVTRKHRRDFQAALRLSEASKCL